MPAAILDATTLKLEIANTAMLNLWDRAPQVIGQQILSFMPEIADQNYLPILQDVTDTGRAHQERDARVMLVRNGRLEPVYMDYSYTPISGNTRRPTAILVLASDLNEKHLNLLSSEEHVRNLRAVVLSAPVAMCIYRGQELKLEIANSLMLDIWQSQQHRNVRMLQHVFFTGMPCQYIQDGINYSCTALRDGKGVSLGCVMIANKIS